MGTRIKYFLPNALSPPSKTTSALIFKNGMGLLVWNKIFFHPPNLHRYIP